MNMDGHRWMSVRAAWMCAMWMALLAPFAGAQVIQLHRPGERDFILDKANLIDAGDELQVKQTCDKLLTDTGSPILVVTIESMAASLKPGRELPWETFARVLFDEWGVGHLTLPNGGRGNAGMLVLVSRDDRKARIELGAGWSMDLDDQAQRIVQQVMVPHFKRAEYSTGIRDAVLALNDSIRQRAGQSAGGSANVPADGITVPPSGADPVAKYRHPSAPSSVSSSSSSRGLPGGVGSLMGCAGIGILIALVLLIIVGRSMGGGLGTYGTRRSRGWYGGGPGFWTGMTMGQMMGSSRSHSSSGGGFFGGGGGFSGGGGGFSGGSFGGGFSGGRGASGSW